MRRASIDIKSGGDLDVNIDSFDLHIRAEKLSPATLVAYVGTAKQFHQYLVDQGMPLNVADIRREHVENFIADLLTHWKPATANNRYRGLQSFFKWALSEGEIKISPMANMKPPRIPENPPPVLSPALKEIPPPTGQASLEFMTMMRNTKSQRCRSVLK